MDKRRKVKISKFMSFVLRHGPQKAGLKLDDQGWASVDLLLRACNQRGYQLSREDLFEIVETNDKQRFALSRDRTRIRASQGHSVEVDLGYAPKEPPALLYHGTARRNLDSIRQQGLVRGRRHHVHLSPDEETARKVGQRHGPPVILTIRAGDMHASGHLFYLSDNGVWLTGEVPPGFIAFPDRPED